MDYLQIHFINVTLSQSEILVAQLSEIGFDGFEEDDNQLKAYVPNSLFDHHLFEAAINDVTLVFTKTIIKKENWNAIWEAGFEPISVPYLNTTDIFVHVRASFHNPIADATYDVEITPKMSFGTGHHATTYLMLQQMSAIEFNNKSVIDFGTGTGILAIVAHKMGASYISAVDIDEWSVTNALENATVNGCKGIDFVLDDKLVYKQKADVLLANINLNIITDHIQAIKKATIKDGIMLFSGIMLQDEQTIVKLLEEAEITIITIEKRGDWMVIKCVNRFA